MNKCEILGEFWISYKYEEKYQDLVSFNDIGFPLAYVVSQGVVSTTPQAEGFINETFDMVLSFFELEDTGFESLEDLMLHTED